MPNTTDVGTLFQNGEIGETGFPEDMSRGNPRHAGADDHDPRISLHTEISTPTVQVMVEQFGVISGGGCNSGWF
jgi:hypothetical protein